MQCQCFSTGLQEGGGVAGLHHEGRPECPFTKCSRTEAVAASSKGLADCSGSFGQGSQRQLSLPSQVENVGILTLRSLKDPLNPRQRLWAEGRLVLLGTRPGGEKRAPGDGVGGEKCKCHWTCCGFQSLLLSRAGDSVKVPIGFGADGLKPTCHSDINLWKVAAQKQNWLSSELS